MKPGTDTLNTRRSLTVGGKSYDYYSLEAAQAQIGDISRLPFSLKVLLENLLRYEDGRTVSVDDIKALAKWAQDRKSDREIAYRPARVLMQDFTGVPAVVDLAAMREAMTKLGGDPKKINPLSPVDLVIDHSVMVDTFGGPDAFEKNVELEFERNGERYEFLRWGQGAFENFRVVPPGTGICHQVNLEYLAQVVWTGEVDGKTVAYPDTLVGTDSHTTMVNGLSVLGWGVGGIEAEAAMLGQPVSMLIPEVIGFKLSGELKEGTTATDLVLTVTEMLRRKGVVGKFVEFYGDGLKHLTLADRATLGNMSPEFGSTCAIFPIDQETLRYLEFTGRDPERVALVEAYAKAQGLWLDESRPEPVYTDSLELDLASVEPSLAGPKRPQDRVPLSAAASAFISHAAKELDIDPVGPEGKLDSESPGAALIEEKHLNAAVAVEGSDYELNHGDVVIAAITSCTNTSNPSVMLGAGLVAKKAHELGLQVKPWVKTSLAPGSQVVTDYLAASGLQSHLDALGFDLVGYGCTTCIGNSGPLPEPIAAAVEKGDLLVCSVLSGNRNFEGRINPHCKANYLASPPLVVAYALAGSMRIDLFKEPLGTGKDGQPIYLKDIWPTNHEIQEVLLSALTPEMFRSRYADVFKGPEKWQEIATSEGETFGWNPASTYVAYPPLLRGRGARAGAGRGHLRRPGAGGAGRLGDHRPHLPGRRDQAREPGRPLPPGAPGAVEGLQLLRRAPRQPRGDDARHLRQHPHPQRDGAGRRGRLHQAPARRRDHGDLRRRHEVPGGGRAAGGDRRQGVRHRLLARLGRQGHPPARRQGGDRRVLRAHPPLEPGRHGRAAAAVQGGAGPRQSRADRRGDLRPAWPGQGPQAAHGGCPAPSAGPTAAAGRSPCSAASIRPTRSPTTRTAASCTTCCAT